MAESMTGTRSRGVIADLENALCAAIEKLWPECGVRPVVYPDAERPGGELASRCCQEVADVVRISPAQIGRAILDALPPLSHTFSLEEGFLNITLGRGSGVLFRDEGSSAGAPATIILPRSNLHLDQWGYARVAASAVVQRCILAHRGVAVRVMLGEREIGGDGVDAFLEILDSSPCDRSGVEEVTRVSAASASTGVSLWLYPDSVPPKLFRTFLGEVRRSLAPREYDRVQVNSLDRQKVEGVISSLSVGGVRSWSKEAIGSLILQLASNRVASDIDPYSALFEERANLPWFLRSIRARIERLGIEPRVQEELSLSDLPDPGIERSLLLKSVLAPMFAARAGVRGKVANYIAMVEEFGWDLARFCNRPALRAAVDAGSVNDADRHIISSASATIFGTIDRSLQLSNGG